MILDADDHYYRRRSPNQRWLIPSAAPTAAVGIGAAAAAAGLARSYFDGTHYFYEKKNDYQHNHHHRRLIDNAGAAYFARGYVPFDRADSWSGYPLINLNIGSSRAVAAAKWRYNKCEEAGRSSSAGFSSNFVIHKQGVPLIRSSNNSRRYNANNNSSNGSSNSSGDNNGGNRRWKDKEVKNGSGNNSTDSGGRAEGKSVASVSPDVGGLRASESGLCGSDAGAEASPRQTTTTTSTTSNGAAAAVGPNSLPRIIKPRKRRKKERKSDPIPSAVSAVKEPPASKNLQATDIANSRRRSSTEEPSSDFIPDENDASSSGEPRQPAPATPAYDLNGGSANVEDGASILASSCRPHSGGTYYDLEGVIWDLDDKLLLLNGATGADRSSSVKKEDWTFKNDDGDGDGKPSSLRRSWSDIGTASSPSNVLVGFSNRSRTASSDCCYGGSYCPEKPENFERAGYASCVGVSSTIVTSPDGHRDIEIKFYSAASASPIVLG